MTDIPTGPIETEPTEAYRGLTMEEVRYMLDQAVAGLDLGAYDRRIIEWAKDMWDQPTTATIASIIMRARQAGQATSIHS